MEMIKLLLSILQLLIIVITSLWAYFRFRKENPLHPRIEFDLDCKFYGPQLDFYLASMTISVRNKGNVEHRFEEIRLKIRGICIDTPLAEFERFPPMLEFPIELVKTVNIVPKALGYYFVRPNVNQAFNFTSRIPANIRFIKVKASFKYQRSDEIHTAVGVFDIQEKISL